MIQAERPKEELEKISSALEILTSRGIIDPSELRNSTNKAVIALLLEAIKDDEIRQIVKKIMEQTETTTGETEKKDEIAIPPTIDSIIRGQLQKRKALQLLLREGQHPEHVTYEKLVETLYPGKPVTDKNIRNAKQIIVKLHKLLEKTGYVKIRNLSKTGYQITVDPTFEKKTRKK